MGISVINMVSVLVIPHGTTTRPEHMLNGKHVVFGSGRAAHKERNNNERLPHGY